MRQLRKRLGYTQLFFATVFISGVILFGLWLHFRNVKHSLLFGEDLKCMKEAILQKVNWAQVFLATNENKLEGKFKGKDKAELCIGIMTTRRQNASFLSLTVASLIDSLSPDDMERVYIVIGNMEGSDQVHEEAYKLAKIVNIYTKYERQSLAFQKMPNPNLEVDVAKFPTVLYTKQVFDYIEILKQCEEHGQYVLILEDDVYTEKGFYTKITDALNQLKGNTDWVFLKLFYSEYHLGITWELAPFVTGCSVVAGLVLFCVLRLQGYTSFWRLFPTCFYFGAFVALCFHLSGKHSIDPLPLGISHISDRCCSPAHVYPSAVVPTLVDYLTAHAYDIENHVDFMLDDFAEKLTLKKYLLIPNLFQHTGLKTNFQTDLAAHYFIWSHNFRGDLFDTCYPNAL